MTQSVEAGMRTAIEELLARYVHCIDNDALEAWPDFFVEDGQYLVTTRQNHSSGWPIGIMYCDGRGMMQDRVTALRKAIVFEPHVYRHIVSSVLVGRAADGSYGVESGFQILRTAAEGTTVIYGCGCCLDEIVAQGSQVLFRKRTVILDSPRIDTLLVIPL
jgi:anthranilate 1,2-dioxygenase small subunit